MRWPSNVRRRSRCLARASAWIASQMGLAPTSGSASRQAVAAKGHASLIGHASNWTSQSSRGGSDRWSFDGVWSREKNRLIWPMCWSLLPAGRLWPRWALLLERVGPWSSVLKRAKERWAWISMRWCSWQGWYRHITLCMLAHAFLMVLRIQSQVQMPQTGENEENEEKKRWRPSQPHFPSQSLGAFKGMRGLACP